MALTKAEMRALSTRLRQDATPDASDLVLLGEVLADCEDALGEVTSKLLQLGVFPTTRLKTSATIIDKLRRQRSLDLTNIQDLAGARIVRPMSLDEQDDLASRIAALWPETRIVDRRAEPSSGYRAVHVIPRVLGRSVEIQLRTPYQNLWAQVMEAAGDLWGRAVRYGGLPSDPETPAWEGASMSRADVITTWIEFSDVLHEHELGENAAAAAGRDPSRQVDALTSADQEVWAVYGPLRDLVRQMLGDVEQW